MSLTAQENNSDEYNHGNNNNSNYGNDEVGDYENTSTGSTNNDNDDILEVKDLNEDTATFGHLVVDLMQRASEATTSNPASSIHMIRRFKLDGFGAHREPPWASSRNIDLFFHALVFHPLMTIQLENIGMFPYDERSGTFPIRLLTRLLLSNQIKPQLTTVELRDIVLEGSTEEWESFCDALQGLPLLKDFVLDTCDCTVGFPLEQFTSFNQMVDRLWRRSSSSHVDGNGVEEVELRNRLQCVTVASAQDYGGTLECGTLEGILLSNSLRQLTLSNVGRIDNDAMTTIFSALSSSGSISNNRVCRLELLDLKNCEFEASAVHTLTDLLSCQLESLTTIKIGIASVLQDSGQEDLYRNEAWMIELFTALKHNRTLQKFVLSSDTPRKLTPASTEAYMEVMQLNCSLLDMFITYPNLHFHPQVMAFYASLNRLGRRRFLKESHLATRTEWIDMLARVSDDESSLFYFLRLNHNMWN